MILYTASCLNNITLDALRTLNEPKKVTVCKICADYVVDKQDIEE